MLGPVTPDFPHGVASFDPTATSVLLWTRTEAADSVHWTVGRDPELTDVVASGRVAVDADADHTAVVAVDELDPATTYHYRFTVDGGASSPVGRTRTLPEGPTEGARLAVVACADLSAAPLTVYRAVSGRDDLDLVLHLGDYVYEDDGSGGDIAVDPPHALVTLDDYRRRYRQARADVDLQGLHARFPFACIWDDHDIADNAWTAGAKAHDPDEHGPWADRLAAARRARDEWLPIRRLDPDRDDVLWRSLPLGDLAELVILDARLGGRDEQVDSAEAPLDDPSRSLLSAEQWDWAGERLTDRQRPWVLVASQVPVSEMRLPLPDSVGDGDAPIDLESKLPLGYAVRDGVALCTDQWDGYPRERDRLVELLDRRGGGAVVLSADVHSTWVFDGPFRTDGTPVAGELTGTAVTSAPMGARLGRAGRALADRLAERRDHVRWVDLEHRGFLVVDVTRDRVRGEAWIVDAEDGAARAERATAWEIGPDRGARWAEASDDDDVSPSVVEGPERPRGASGGPRPRRPRRLARAVARAAAVAAVVAVLRPVWRPILRRLRARS